MTKWQAVGELEKIFDRWLDFDFWAYLQIEMRGEWSDERMQQVMDNHKRAELKLRQYRAEVDKKQLEMRAAGATLREINDYANVTRGEELHRLVTAWRSLEGLPAEGEEEGV